MKIKMFQTGGGFATFTPIIYAQPAAAATGKSTESGGSKKSISSVLDDETFKELVSKGGLVNDVNNLVNELAKIESSSANAYGQSSNRTASLRMIGKINELRQNKGDWERALGVSKEAGGLGEVAVGSYGEVYQKDAKGKVKALDINEYNKVKEKQGIKLLTVAELLNERQYNPQLAGQNTIFNVANNAIGLSKITDQVKGLVSALGTELTEDTKSYSSESLMNTLKSYGGKKPTQKEADAMKELYDVLSTPSEFYKITTEKSSERGHTKEALNYIWKTLGQNAQQKLTAVAAINGEANPKQFILDMIVSQTNESLKSAVTPTKDAAGTTGEGGAGKTSAISPQELFHNDRLYKPGMTYEFNNPKAGVTIKAVATGKGPLFSLGKEGEVLQAGAITDIFTKNNYASIVDPNQAYVGDSKINPLFLPEIAYTGSDVAKVYMPVKDNGTPDLAQMERFNNAYQVFDINKDKWSVKQIQDYFRKAGFSGIQIKESVGSDGKRIKVIGENGKVKPFLALPIITNSASDISNNAWMVEMTGDEATAGEQLMKQSFTTIGGTPTKPKLINKMPSKWNALETPYKGTLFVAYRPEASAILSATQGRLVGRSATETDLYRNLNYSSSSIGGIQPSASLLKNQ